MKSLEQAHSIALECRTRAYCRYSGFPVGAAIKPREEDRLFGGCNVENASYGATICAERAALLSMISAIGQREIEYVVVATDADPLAVPCAECLQVLAEFSRPDTMVYIADIESVRDRYRFEELLPYPFKFG